MPVKDLLEPYISWFNPNWPNKTTFEVNPHNPLSSGKRIGIDQSAAWAQLWAEAQPR